MKLRLCFFLAVVFTASFTTHSNSEESKVAASATPRASIDARGVKMLDRSIAIYKKLRSFSMQAEEVFKDGNKLRYASFLFGVQWPWRAKLDIYSKTDPIRWTV